MVQGYSGDWILKDIQAIKEEIIGAYENKRHDQLFWDEIVDANLNKLCVKVEPIKNGQII